MSPLVACTLGVHKVDETTGSNGKENTSISVTHAQGWGVLSLIYFKIFLSHHAGPFENLGEDKSRFMASGRNVKFSLLLIAWSNMFLVGRLSLGESAVVVDFVVVFSQSYSFASKTKVCTLSKLLVDKL